MESSSVELPPTLAAPHSSRVFVREFLTRNDAKELAFVGEILTSELVTNVVYHAHSDVTVDLSWEDDTLRVEVRDGSSILPAVADLADENGGYGLRVVETLADEWGVRALEHGKAVWFLVRRESEETPT